MYVLGVYSLVPRLFWGGGGLSTSMYRISTCRIKLIMLVLSQVLLIAISVLLGHSIIIIVIQTCDSQQIKINDRDLATYCCVRNSKFPH